MSVIAGGCDRAGVFRCALSYARDISEGGKPSAHARATRLHSDQQSDKQEAEVIIDDGLPGERLGDGPRLPAPLRQTVELGDSRVAILGWTPCMPETLATPRGGA